MDSILKVARPQGGAAELEVNAFPGGNCKSENAPKADLAQAEFETITCRGLRAAALRDCLKYEALRVIVAATTAIAYLDDEDDVLTPYADFGGCYVSISRRQRQNSTGLAAGHDRVASPSSTHARHENARQQGTAGQAEGNRAAYGRRKGLARPCFAVLAMVPYPVRRSTRYQDDRQTEADGRPARLA